MRADQILKYETYVNEIKARKITLEDQLSLVDRKRTDVMHLLELEKCDAIIMMKAAKKLKELSQERRAIKEELSLVHHIYDKVKNPIPKKIYKPEEERYSTDVVKELLDK